MLADTGVPIAEKSNSTRRNDWITITIDRSSCKPCIFTASSSGDASPHVHGKKHLIGLERYVGDSTLSSIASELQCKETSNDSLKAILSAMNTNFFEQEAFSLSVALSRDSLGQLAVLKSSLILDDAAFRSSKRHADIHALRDFESEVPEEVEAERHGIVYIK